MTTKYRDIEIRAPRGTTLTAKSWLTEAPLRMLMNNLDPEVAELWQQGERPSSEEQVRQRALRALAEEARH